MPQVNAVRPLPSQVHAQGDDEEVLAGRWRRRAGRRTARRRPRRAGRRWRSAPTAVEDSPSVAFSVSTRDSAGDGDLEAVEHPGHPERHHHPGVERRPGSRSMRAGIGLRIAGPGGNSDDVEDILTSRRVPRATPTGIHREPAGSRLECPAGPLLPGRSRRALGAPGARLRRATVVTRRGPGSGAATPPGRALRGAVVRPILAWRPRPAALDERPTPPGPSPGDPSGTATGAESGSPGGPPQRPRPRRSRLRQPAPVPPPTAGDEPSHVRRSPQPVYAGRALSAKGRPGPVTGPGRQQPHAAAGGPVRAAGSAVLARGADPLHAWLHAHTVDGHSFRRC